MCTGVYKIISYNLQVKTFFFYLRTVKNSNCCPEACDVETLSMAYGLCWEPALTQCSIALNYLTGNSFDPSAPLPFWDKVSCIVAVLHQFYADPDLKLLIYRYL